jgi:SAM-dependent methyltransferase
MNCVNETMSDPSRTQTWTASGYQQHARFVSDLGMEILGWLAPGQGERILDLGCGDGVHALEIAETGAEVVGVDVSQDMLAQALERGVDAREMDGEALSFENEFDAVFSNAALHWMSRPERVIAGVARALKPGGRFVAEFGGHGNVAAIVTALRAIAKMRGADADLAGPWFFPTVDEYAGLLEEGGFEVERIALVPRPTPLPTGLAGWLETFGKIFLDQFDEPVRADVVAEAEELLAPSLRDSAGNWTADYVRLRVAAKLTP